MNSGKFPDLKILIKYCITGFVSFAPGHSKQMNRNFKKRDDVFLIIYYSFCKRHKNLEIIFKNDGFVRKWPVGIGRTLS